MSACIYVVLFFVSFQVKEITSCFIKWRSNLNSLMQQRIMSNNKKVAMVQAGPQSEVFICTKFSMKVHTESKCTYIFYLTIFCVMELQTILLSLFLSLRKSSGESFKRNSRTDEFFSSMKSFLGIFFFFLNLQMFWEVEL